MLENVDVVVQSEAAGLRGEGPGRLESVTIRDCRSGAIRQLAVRRVFAIGDVRAGVDEARRTCRRGGRRSGSSNPLFLRSIEHIGLVSPADRRLPAALAQSPSTSR